MMCHWWGVLWRHHVLRQQYVVSQKSGRLAAEDTRGTVLQAISGVFCGMVWNITIAAIWQVPPVRNEMDHGQAEQQRYQTMLHVTKMTIWTYGFSWDDLKNCWFTLLWERRVCTAMEVAEIGHGSKTAAAYVSECYIMYTYVYTHTYIYTYTYVYTSAMSAEHIYIHIYICICASMSTIQYLHA